MKKNSNRKIQREITLDGMMTFGKLQNNLRTADFECCETAEVEPFVARCRVQAIRNGNVYITELPRRIRNTPLFRQANSSMSLGRNGQYYFVFTLPESEVTALPETLVREAREAAKKMSKMIGN